MRKQTILMKVISYSLSQHVSFRWQSDLVYSEVIFLTSTQSSSVALKMSEEALPEQQHVYLKLPMHDVLDSGQRRILATLQAWWYSAKKNLSSTSKIKSYRPFYWKYLRFLQYTVKQNAFVPVPFTHQTANLDDIAIQGPLYLFLPKPSVHHINIMNFRAEY